MAHETFSDQIRQAIKDTGLSRYRICCEAKIDQGLMSRFMSGKSSISMDALDRLAVVIGLSVTRKRQRPKGE
jgi:transcriptional regulator with XRE-family HTH domain